jgi:branched-chain amino acid aminotransferase
MIVFLNGGFRQENECGLPINDRGLTLADGVFDTMLAADGAPVWAREHFARLTYGASVLGIGFTMDFEDTAHELLRQNNFLQGRYAVRTTVTRGAGGRGLAPPDTVKPAILMTAAPAPLQTGRVETIIAETVRRNEHSPLSRIKSLNYGDNIIALREAQSKGAHDAIMLNGAGHVCCATTSNIFTREGEKLFTPPLTDGVLPGIMREKVMSSHDVTEESLAPERLFEADAVFLTNSIAGIRTVKRIDHTYFSKQDEFILAGLAA